MYTASSVADNTLNNAIKGSEQSKCISEYEIMFVFRIKEKIIADYTVTNFVVGLTTI